MKSHSSQVRQLYSVMPRPHYTQLRITLLVNLYFKLCCWGQLRRTVPPSTPRRDPTQPIQYNYISPPMKSNGQSTRLSLDSLRKRLEHYSYSSHEKLGTGYSSEVFRGRDDRTGKLVAIKVVNLHRVRQKNQEELLLREVRLLQQIKHPHILGCLDALMTSNNCYIITDYCADGDLGALLKRKGRLAVDESLPLLHDIAQAAAHLHCKSVIHRDIKPHNILLHRNRAKLADFGFATRCETSVRDGYKIGSPLYMSPEALNEREYSRKSDVWALGVTFFEVLEGRDPWEVKTENELKQSFNKEIQFKHVHRQNLQDLIRGCLLVDPQSRLTAQQVLVRLEKAIGGPSLMSYEPNKENKQNVGNGNSQTEGVISEDQQKSDKNNYNILKWLINYSRFSAKYLAKLQQSSLASDIREPLVELTARCLHMTISKLKRIEQFHVQLGIVHFQSFKRTTKFIKIRAVTQQYHPKYLMMLAKLSYKYSLGNNMALELTHHAIRSLQTLQADHEHSILLEGFLTLMEANHWAKKNSLNLLVQMVDFQQLIEKMDRDDQGTVLDRKVEERRKKLLQELQQKGGHQIVA